MFPLAFATLAFMAILGGFLYSPANYDALAYRVPRILHWLTESKWHWIHTDFHRLNTRGNGIEWLTAPLIVFTGSDRFFFLINAVSFLLLPGICYRLLTNLGVRKKVAWYWMWILPTGYCYLLQAGSIANDMFGSVFAFAAVDYALRAARAQNVALSGMSVLAAALATSVKAFNILLFIPWVLAMIPNFVPMLRRPLFTFVVGVFAILVSIVPTSIINYYYSGDWKGLNAEPVKLGGGSPSFQLGINSILIPLHHLNPPVNPFAGKWNQWTEEALPVTWQEKLGNHFEPSVTTFKLGEMQMEETAGLGLGVTLLILAVLLGRQRRVSERVTNASVTGFKVLMCSRNLVPIGAALATFYFLSQSGLGCPSRYLSPFYMMLVAPILRLPRASELITKKWWHRLSLLCFSMAALLLVLNPPRPLWPVKNVFEMMGTENRDSPLLTRVYNVYSVYGDRSDGFAAVKKVLPPDLNTLGLVTFDDPETSLWKPFGAMSIRHVTLEDDVASLHSRNIEYILVSEYTLKTQGKYTLDEWLVRFDSEIISSQELTLRAGRGSTLWHLVRVRQ
jgi:hypothetical protein